MIVTTLTGIIQHTPRVNSTRGTNSERVLNLSVGVRQRVKVDGQWTNETMWIAVALFGGRADGLANILKKGGQVGATGELRLRKYEGRDGTPKTAIELVAHNLWPLDWSPRPQDGAGDGEERQPFRAQHRDELAGDRTRGGDAVRGQRELAGMVDPNTGNVHRDRPAFGERQDDPDFGADGDDIPF